MREDEGEKIAQTGDLASAGSFILGQKCQRRLVALLKVACMSVFKKNEKEKILIKDINVTLSQTFVSQMMQYGYMLRSNNLLYDIFYKHFSKLKKPQTGTNNRIICQDATLCSIVTDAITQSV